MSKNTDASNQYPPDQELSSDPMKAGGFISFIKREMGSEAGSLFIVMSTGQLVWVWDLIPFSAPH